MNRFTSSMIRAFLEKYITSGFKVYNDKMPNTGRVAYVTMQPGFGLDLEGISDSPAFNVTCRGAENNYDDAESIALEIDSIIINYGTFPFEMNGVYVWMMDRSGGAPQQLLVEDKANRYTFSCNYYAKVSTNIGEVYS